ncbi:glutathione S-transferase family protein [Archangium primigenium]|uniref:glutathione S-transferase family protein n=1 Tax=[Archangium] primigenium TaxID=2792470 RepID=UPI00195722FF|nr:glutathione S-transferase family protein [Archangium primigenium]MBM7115089.1 glutathione S-transferase family protein [Archangium primigenium]
MKLYFAPRTRATRPRWLLEELKIPYELVRVDPAQPPPELQTLNPFGEVPVLVDDSVTLFESASICLYLADRHPEKGLAPAPHAPERGAYYQWLLFAERTLEPLALELRRGGPLAEPERKRLDDVLTVVERALGDREVLVGSAFTAADLVMASLLHMLVHAGALESRPRLVDYVKRHTSRPALRSAMS